MPKVYLDGRTDFVFLQNSGFDRIVGIDEVGRGSWAGPVAVSGYIFTKDEKILKGVNDSKLLTKFQRSTIFSQVPKEKYIIKFGSVSIINSIGIQKTIENLIEEIIDELYSENTFFLIDGIFKKNFVKNSQKIIRGDSQFYSIAMSSIIAKVKRDTLLKIYSKKFPQFGLEKNVGYPSFYHRENLQIFGPSEIHRTSFKPIKELLNKKLELKKNN